MWSIRSSSCRSLLQARQRLALRANGKNSKNNNNSSQRWMGGGGGDMPVPQSQNAPLWNGHKVQNEGWETTMYFYFVAAVALQAAIFLGAPPETSIESWARSEAKARLLLVQTGQVDELEFGKHYQTMVDDNQAAVWSKFSDRAIVPGEDDDDDDEDEDEEEDDDDDDDEVSTLYVSNYYYYYHYCHIRTFIIGLFFIKLIFRIYRPRVSNTSLFLSH